MQFILIYVSKYFWGLMGAGRAPVEGVGPKPLHLEGQGRADVKSDLDSRKLRGN